MHLSRLRPVAQSVQSQSECSDLILESLISTLLLEDPFHDSGLSSLPFSLLIYLLRGTRHWFWVGANLTLGNQHRYWVPACLASVTRPDWTTRAQVTLLHFCAVPPALSKTPSHLQRMFLSSVMYIVLYIYSILIHLYYFYNGVPIKFILRT